MMSFRAKYAYILLFIVLFAHVSILDLFFVGYHGPVFLWEENLSLRTVAVHLTTALIAVICFGLFSLMRKDVNKGRVFLSDKVLIVCSCALVFSILVTIS